MLILKEKFGFSLVEVILAVAVLAVIVTAFVGALVLGLESIQTAGFRTRAGLIAEEGLEAVRNIRDDSFSTLMDGTYGLVTTGNKWTLSGSSDVTGVFTRAVNISTVSADKKTITSTVTWPQTSSRNGTVSLVTRLTNWQDVLVQTNCINQSDYLVIDSSSPGLGQVNKQLNNIFVSNSNSGCDIVVDKVTIAWTSVTRNIKSMKIGTGLNVWTGTASSGTLLDVTDTTLSQTDGQKETQYVFDGNMRGNTFSITFTMEDGTSKNVSGISP